MHTASMVDDNKPVVERDALEALGVLMPIRLSPLKFLPGRHPLGRAGSGLRFLRTRPFEQGEDNPRDIDKFSPPNDRQVIEWEEEAQSSITLLSDISASMSSPLKSSLRNACILQLTYSLWRAGDRVGTIFFSSDLHKEIKAANLKTQMERLASELSDLPSYEDTKISSVLLKYLYQVQRNRPDIIFVISDFVISVKDHFRLNSNWLNIIKTVGNNVIPVIITFSVPGTVGGMLKVWDPERKVRRLTWFSSSRIKKINREEQERVEKMINTFRSIGLDYLVISDQQQIYPQLAQLARIRRGRKN